MHDSFRALPGRRVRAAQELPLPLAALQARPAYQAPALRHAHLLLPPRPAPPTVLLAAVPSASARCWASLLSLPSSSKHYNDFGLSLSWIFTLVSSCLIYTYTFLHTVPPSDGLILLILPVRSPVMIYHDWIVFIVYYSWVTWPRCLLTRGPDQAKWWISGFGKQWGEGGQPLVVPSSTLKESCEIPLRHRMSISKTNETTIRLNVVNLPGRHMLGNS